MFTWYVIGIVVFFGIFMLLELMDAKKTGRLSRGEDTRVMLVSAVLWPLALMYVLAMFISEKVQKDK